MKLNQITLGMRNIDESVAFYEALGLRLIVRSDPDYLRFECPDGDGDPTTLSLVLMSDDEGPGVGEVFFQVKDMEAEVERLRVAGIVVSDIQDQPWLWREAEMRDPAGNRLKLFDPGPNRRFPPWRLP